MDITKFVDKYFRPFVASAAAIFLIPWVLYLELVLPTHYEAYQIGRASCRERVCAIV